MVPVASLLAGSGGSIIAETRIRNKLLWYATAQGTTCDSSSGEL
jgi:hypothetical protein